jgi:TonB dependent receptor
VVGFNPGAPSIVAGANTGASATNGGGGNYLGGLVYASPSQRSPYASSYKNFQPRFGFAYQINPKMVVRGGWGRSYDNAGAYTFLPTTGFTNVTTAQTSTDGSGATALLCSQISGCAVPSGNPLAGISANGFASALPNGLIPATGSTLGAKTGAGGSVTFLDPTFRPSYVNQFNVGFDYQLPYRMVAHLEYNGSRAHGLPVNKSINQLTASQFLSLGIGANATVTNPFAGLLPGTSLNGATTTLGQLLRPFPQYTDVVQNNQPIGRLWYNALQAKLDKRLSHGLDAYANFTWSKNLGATSYLNPNYDIPTNLTRQLVGQDIPFATNIGMTWKLPIFTSDQHKFLRATLGGWSISGTAAFHSGSLIGSPSGTSGVVWTGVNPAQVNASFRGRSFNSAYNGCVINSAGTALLANAACPSTATIGTAAWRQTPNSFYLSNIPPFFGANRYASPPYSSAVVFKAFQVTERVKAEIRVLGENITNTPYFTSLTSNTPTAPTFTQLSPTESNDPRSLQFTARISF